MVHKTRRGILIDDGPVPELRLQAPYSIKRLLKGQGNSVKAISLLEDKRGYTLTCAIEVSIPSIEIPCGSEIQRGVGQNPVSGNRGPRGPCSQISMFHTRGDVSSGLNFEQ